MKKTTVRKIARGKIRKKSGASRHSTMARKTRIPKTSRAQPSRPKQDRNRYQCDSCEWVYDPTEHNGVDIDDQPEGWACERCLADRDHFQLVIPSDDDYVSPEEGADTLNKSLGRRLATVKDTEPDVDSLQRRNKKGRLKLQPDFQRYEVWNVRTKSQLIESILLELPIPSIYIAEERDGSYVVVDGQQRLAAIFRFLDGKYALKGLSILTKLDGSHYDDLTEPSQETIQNRTLKVTEIRKETDPDVRFQLFERLNRGSIKLNDQELRNCIYRGDYNAFLKRLATNPDLRKCLHLSTPHKRMVDVELVLRFMAFQDQTYLKFPDKRTNKFLNDQMEKIGPRLDKTKLAANEKSYTDSLSASLSIFADKAFKRFAPGDTEGADGKWERRINRALMDVVLYSFSRHKKGVLISNADAIKEMAIELMSNDKFADLIRHTISEKKRVEARFSMWTTRLDNLLGPDSSGARAFDYATKEALFRSNPKCSICSNRILEIDDAHVDHVQAYSKGGKTKRANAALSHRFCNQSKGSRSAKAEVVSKRRARSQRLFR